MGEAAWTRILAGVTTIVVALFIIINILPGLHLPEISAQTWASFAGAVLGAMVTVGTSIFAFEYQRRRALRSKRIFVRDAVAEVLALLDALQANNPMEFERRVGRSVVAQCDKIEAGLTWLQSIMEWQRPEDIRMLRAYDEIRQISDAAKLTLRQSCVEVMAQQEGPMPGVIGSTYQIRERLRSAIRSVG